LNDVEKLWELQSVFSALNDREKQMAVKPESFATIDREYTAANEEMERLQQQIDALAKERRRIDGELSDQQELLKKYQGQLMQVKNQQQYAAAWKEIDAARKHAKELEESELKNMSDAEALQKQLEERQAGHDELKSRYDAAHDEWQHSLGDLKKESEDLRKKVEMIEAGIPRPLRDMFHRVYKQRQQVAVTRVERETCSTCRTKVRPALFQQLKRGEMVYCEGCHRILFTERAS
jgi:predicted  nucleic acid-binding Zn-ribbon protein